MERKHVITKTLICSLIVIGSLQVQAQYVSDYKRTANMYFDKGDYYAAAQYYEKYLSVRQKKNNNTDLYKPYLVASASRVDKKDAADYEKVVSNLADSYRMYFDYVNAEKWYAAVVQFDQPSFPLSKYWYGVCLRANKKYADAETQFTSFLSSYAPNDTYKENATKELNNVKFIQQQLAANTYHGAAVRKLSSTINRGGATYAPVWMDDNSFVFTSSRPDSSVIQTTKNENPYYNNLYKATVADTGFANADKIEIAGDKNIQEGVATFSSDKSRVFFTRWTKKDGKNIGAIFTATRSGDSWANPQKLSAAINVEGFSSIQPFISADNKVLYFSSDRPGGAGGYDLWYAPMNADGKPDAAINMGTLVNTKGDDQAPYYHSPTHTLVFASNGRVGMGGFDLYKISGDITRWIGEPENMGYPINSTKDDIYFTTKGTRNLLSNAVFSSDRNSVCCLELYEAKKKNKFVSGKIVDCKTGEPLIGAKVNLIDTSKNQILTTSDINATGAYVFELEDFQSLKIVAEKASYGSHSLVLGDAEKVQADTLYNPDLCLLKDTVVPYTVGRPVVLQGIYYDFDKATLRPESYPVLDTLASVMKQYPAMAIQLGAHTDAKGSVDYNLKLSAARAKSCVDYLASVGIAPERLISKGFGKCCPIAPNEINGKDNPAGRQLNRRTEFTVIHY